MIHFHKWHFVDEVNDISWEVMRWDSKRMITNLKTAFFVCTCGKRKTVITDTSYGKNNNDNDPTWTDALFYEGKN